MAACPSQQANTPHGDGKIWAFSSLVSVPVVTTGKYPSRGWKTSATWTMMRPAALSQQANTPHGDGKQFRWRFALATVKSSQQANTPHGDGNLILVGISSPLVLVSQQANTPHGDGNLFARRKRRDGLGRHNRQIPLTGMETVKYHVAHPYASNRHNRQIPLTGMETMIARPTKPPCSNVTTGKYPSRGWKP